MTQHCTPGAEISAFGRSHFRLVIPAGGAGRYRLAQLDDYTSLRRGEFPWAAPGAVRLSARASGNDLPGTWGFGLWNDPFGAGLAHGGTRLLPALPQAVWFFFASQPNYLSFRDDQPAVGQLAGVFSSPRLPTWPFLPLGLGVPLLFLHPVARLARSAASKIVREQAAGMALDVTVWHDYALIWEQESVRLSVDGREVLRTDFSSKGPLGLVIWIDNQYAAWRPDGGLSYGTLDSQSCWIEVKELDCG